MKEYVKIILRNWKRWVYFVGGALAVSLGFMLGGMWSETRNSMLLAIATISLIPFGVFLIWKGWNKVTDVEAVIVGSKKPTTPVNSLNIYAKKDKDSGKIYPEKIEFTWMEKPMGQPQQCLNNGKWYYVHIWDIAKNTLKPFTLPDSQYFDPREFANVIKMPAHKKLFERQVSTFQKVAPWVMVVAFLISVLGLITTTPTG